MILDSSAIVAILVEEQEMRDLLAKMDRASYRAVSGPILVESVIVLTGRLKADATIVLSEFLQEFEISLVPFGDDHWREAERLQALREGPAFSESKLRRLYGLRHREGRGLAPAVRRERLSQDGP